MIDLAAAYEQLNEILHRHGLDESSYCIILEVWNHRAGGGGLGVTFTVSALVGMECVQAYQRVTIDSAIGDLDRMLAERAHRLAGEPPGDLHVELPGAEMGADAAAIAAFEADVAQAHADAAEAGQGPF